jgi:hypothetical protein
MKKTITGYVHMLNEPDYEDFDGRNFVKKWAPGFRAHRYEDENSIFISEQQFTVELPDDFDPIPGQVAALEEKKREALAEYQRTVAEINERLSKLQAIEFAP